MVDVWSRICMQRQNSLRDAAILEQSMQIIVSHAHDVLNKRKNLIFIPSICVLSNALLIVRWDYDIISNENGTASECQGTTGEQGSIKRIGCAVENEIND